MLTLHIEAQNHVDLVRAVCRALGIQITSAPAPAEVPAATPPAPMPVPVAEASKVEAPAAAAPVATSPATPARRVGRPRKTEQAPAGAPSAVPASQATVGTNGASAPATAHPSAAEAAPVASPAAATAAVSFTHDQVKAALQKVASRSHPGGADGALEDAGKIIGKFGYTRVKDLKPEHFAAIVADCNKLLAA